MILNKYIGIRLLLRNAKSICKDEILSVLVNRRYILNFFSILICFDMLTNK